MVKIVFGYLLLISFIMLIISSLMDLINRDKLNDRIAALAAIIILSAGSYYVYCGIKYLQIMNK